MSLAAAQIFVRTTDAETLERIVAESLVEWAAGVGPMPVTDDGVPLPPPERRIVLLPPVEGWITVTEENGRLDRSLARRIALEMAALTLGAELEGHFLTASIETYEADGETDSWGVPDTSGDDGRMPMYSDGEAELYTRLRARGVPASLIATEWEEMIDTKAPAAKGARLRADAGLVGLDKTILPFGDIRSLDLVDGPRVRPDLWVTGPDGLAQVVEARRVTGEWHTEALESLARIEEEQLSRILSTLAWTTEDTRLPDVVFRYEGVDDDAFFTAMNALRRRRPVLSGWAKTEWLSIVGLVDALRTAAKDVLPAFEVGLRCGRRVEVRHARFSNWSFFVDLAALWRTYLQAPESIGTLLPARLEATLEAVLAPETLRRERLFPLFLGADSPDLPLLAVRPFTKGVWTAIGLDTHDAIRPVSREALKGSGLGFDDALEIAVHRLELATEQNDGFVLYEQPEGMTLRAEFPDVSTAARILSSAVLAHIAQQLGDECYVAIPARDVLVAAEGTKEARKWLEREVARRYKANDLALSPQIWSIQNGELVEDAVADLSADEWGASHVDD